jgi:hypothetical protein
MAGIWRRVSESTWCLCGNSTSARIYHIDKSYFIGFGEEPVIDLKIDTLKEAKKIVWRTIETLEAYGYESCIKNRA